MKTTLTHRFPVLPIMATALIAASPTNAATVFSANFDATTAGNFGGTIGYGALVTSTNLDAGTAIGTWTVNQAQATPTQRYQTMIQTAGGANVTNKALRFGIGFGGGVGVDVPILTANLTSTLNLSNTINVSFDAGYVDTQGLRLTYLTGLDGSNNRLFQIGFVNEDAGATFARLAYVSSAGTTTYIGANGDLLGNTATYWNSALMKNVTVDVGASTYDIKLNGSSLTGGSGIAFRDAAANGLSKLQFSSNNAATGTAFDNITVSQIPEPSGALLGGLGFFFLLRRRR